MYTGLIIKRRLFCGVFCNLFKPLREYTYLDRNKNNRYTNGGYSVK